MSKANGDHTPTNQQRAQADARKLHERIAKARRHFRWPMHPLRPGEAQRYANCDGVIYLCGGNAHAYTPTIGDRADFRRLFPDEDECCPAWERIRAELIGAGWKPAELHDLEPADTLAAIQAARQRSGEAGAGESRDTGTPKPAGRVNTIGKGMTWQEAEAKAVEHVKAHGGVFPSVNRLAKAVGCSRPTMDKAISKSKYLQARKAEAEQARTTGREVSLPNDVLENLTAEARVDELQAAIAEQAAEMAQEEHHATREQYRRR